MSAANVEPRDSRRLRVLTVTPRYLPLVGGTELHTYETARRIAARHDVTILTTNPGGQLAAEECRDQLRILRVAAWPAQRDYYVAPAIAGVIARRDWDIVHCQGIHTLFAPLAMLSAWRAGIPYVVTFHSGGHSSRLRTLARSTQWTLLGPLLRHARRLIGVSQYEVDFFRRQLRLPAARFAVIPNGVQLPCASLPALPPPSCQPLIVSVGRLERYKGHHRVIDALPYVLARHPDARLRIIGSGPYAAQLARQAQARGVADRVQIGPIAGADREAMAVALSEASVVTLLSDYESQGIAAWEALQLRRPVLVSDCSAFSELAQRGLARAVALESSPQQVATAIVGQLDDPLVPSNVALPSWDDCAAQLLTVYRSINGSPSCAS